MHFYVITNHSELKCHRVKNLIHQYSFWGNDIPADFLQWGGEARFGIEVLNFCSCFVPDKGDGTATTAANGLFSVSVDFDKVVGDPSWRSETYPCKVQKTTQAHPQVVHLQDNTATIVTMNIQGVTLPHILNMILRKLFIRELYCNRLCWKYWVTFNNV